MINSTRLMPYVLFLSLTACNHLPTVKTSLWQLKDSGSVTINNSPPIFFEEKLLLAEKNKEVCLAYSSYFGDLLIASTLYQGTISRGRVDVYEKKILYRQGERLWKNVEPIEILVGKSDLAIRFEKSTDPSDAYLVLFKKMNQPISEYNSEELSGIHEINYIAECESLLQTKISDKAIEAEIN